MKKKLAILFASLSLCACTFVGCGDDKKDDSGDQNVVKAAEGEKCGASADNKECKDDTLECVKKGGEGEDANEFICKKKDQGAEKAAEGEKCGASADGKECKDDSLECVKKGGEGEDAEELICKKKEQGVEPSGKVKKGGACVIDSTIESEQCDTGLVCEGDESAAVCKIDVNGDCNEAGDDALCAEHSFCEGEEGHKICQGVEPPGKVKKGGACVKDSTVETEQCDTGLVCEGDESAATCKIAANGACNAEGDAELCADGLICDGAEGAKTCQESGEVGEKLEYMAACVLANDNCGTGLVCEVLMDDEPVCLRKRNTICANDFDFCENDYECKRGDDDTDTELKCREIIKLDNDSECSWGGECKSGFCQRIDEDTKQCKDKLAANAPCSMDAGDECVDGFECRTESAEGTEEKCFEELLWEDDECDMSNDKCSFLDNLKCYQVEGSTPKCKHENGIHCLNHSDCGSNYCDPAEEKCADKPAGE